MSGTTQKAEGGGTETLEKIAKLIPSEVITGYSGLITLFLNVKGQKAQYVAFGLTFVLGLVLTPLYLNKMAEKGKPKRNHLILSTFAFIVWAYFTSGRQVVPNLYDGIWATATLFIFTMISGAVPLNT